jgi:small subunit ribosomal protein S7
MSRRRRAEKREIQPDPKFGNIQFTRFINRLMEHGKRSTAESIFYGCLDSIHVKTKRTPTEVFEEAISNIRPVMELKSRRVGGATYQVPVDVRLDRSIDLAQRWMIESSRKRGEKTMALRLAAEIMDAAQNRGASIKKKEETHKMAEANRAFAHLKWGA